MKDDPAKEILIEEILGPQNVEPGGCDCIWDARWDNRVFVCSMHRTGEVFHNSQEERLVSR